MNERWRALLWPEGGIWLALIGLLMLTIGLAYVPAAGVAPILNLAVAASMGLLVVVFFMNLSTASGLIRLVASLGVLWLAVLFVLTFADVLTR